MNTWLQKEITWPVKQDDIDKLVESCFYLVKINIPKNCHWVLVDSSSPLFMGIFP